MIRIFVVIFLAILIYMIIRDIKKSFSTKKDVKRTTKKDNNDIDRSRIEDAKFKEIDNDKSESNNASNNR